MTKQMLGMETKRNSGTDPFKGNRDRCVTLPRRTLELLRRLWRAHRHPRWIWTPWPGLSLLEVGCWMFGVHDESS
jgi:hypothetical protein